MFIQICELKNYVNISITIYKQCKMYFITLILFFNYTLNFTVFVSSEFYLRTLFIYLLLFT